MPGWNRAPGNPCWVWRKIVPQERPAPNFAKKSRCIAAPAKSGKRGRGRRCRDSAERTNPKASATRRITASANRFQSRSIGPMMSCGFRCNFQANNPPGPNQKKWPARNRAGQWRSVSAGGSRHPQSFKRSLKCAVGALPGADCRGCRSALRRCCRPGHRRPRRRYYRPPSGGRVRPRSRGAA